MLELTFREALRMGHNYIRTEHILLALAEFENGGAAACPAIPASLIAAAAGPTCQPLPPESHRISHPQPAPSAGSPDHPNLHPDTHYLPADPERALGGYSRGVLRQRCHYP